MRLSNYLCLLIGIVVTRAQDDNPSGHEVHDYMFGESSIRGTYSLDESSTSTTSTGTFSLDDTRTTSVITFDDSAFKMSDGNKNVLEYNMLLWGFLLL